MELVKGLCQDALCQMIFTKLWPAAWCYLDATMAGYLDLVIDYYAALKILPLWAATSALVGYQVAFSRQRQHGPFRRNIKNGPKDDTNQMDGADAKLSVMPDVEELFVLVNLTLARFSRIQQRRSVYWFYMEWMMAKPATLQIKLVSTADTGFYYVTKKNPRTKPEKLELKKYDPRARKHVLFREAKIK